MNTTSISYNIWYWNSEISIMKVGLNRLENGNRSATVPPKVLINLMGFEE